MQLQQEILEQQNEISRESRLKEKLDKEVKKLHVDMEAKTGDIRTLNAQVQRTAEEQQRLEHQLKELKVNADKQGAHTHRTRQQTFSGCNSNLIPLHFPKIFLYKYRFKSLIHSAKCNICFS